MITVDYPPGAGRPGAPPRRAHSFVYVLEGSIVMGEGRKEVTLTPGQTFYEGPQRHPHRGAQREQHRSPQGSSSR